MIEQRKDMCFCRNAFSLKKKTGHVLHQGKKQGNVLFTLVTSGKGEGAPHLPPFLPLALYIELESQKQKPVAQQITNIISK
jgi:hypothetical protein